MLVAERIAGAGPALTTAERRVAEVVLDRPQLVAFGTVAELATQSRSGAATVVRLAGKLGYDGFTGLQDEVRRELASRLRPAAERIREPVGADLVVRQLSLELDNVRATLEAVDAVTLEQVSAALADQERPVVAISGDASRGIASQLVGDLAALRAGVELLDGNPVAVRRRLAGLDGHEVVVAIDLRRYDRWVVDAVQAAATAGCWILAITDSVLSPIAGPATRTLTVAAGSTGPFDSHVGTLALANLLVTAAADALRATAADRLERAEQAWADHAELVDR